MPIDAAIAEVGLPHFESAGPGAIPAAVASPYEFRLIVRGEGDEQQHSLLSRGASEAAFRDSLEAVRRDAFEEGRREGERAARAENNVSIAAAIAQERARVTAAIQGFGDARAHYFARVEQEAVKLSLAIAARILHREAQLDPLLLSSAVRVALDKLADRSGVTLRVPADQVGTWQEMLQHIESGERPAVAADPSLLSGECILETRMGTVELGVSAQLEEIERGFFDLLNCKPVS